MVADAASAIGKITVIKRTAVSLAPLLSVTVYPLRLIEVSISLDSFPLNEVAASVIFFAGKCSHYNVVSVSKSSMSSKLV